MDTRTRSRKRVVDWQAHTNCAECSLARGESFQCALLPRREGGGAPIDKLAYGARTSLYGEGDPAHFIYVIREGLLKLTQLAINGMPRIVRFLHKGQLAGLEALSGGPYRHTAEAILPAVVCRVPLESFRNHGHDPSIAPHLFSLWQRTTDDADMVITQLSTGTAQGRVARFLLHVLSEGKEDHCVALSREDMSALLSVTVETVSRTVAEFKRQGLLQESKGVFHFDRRALAPLAAL